MANTLQHKYTSLGLYTIIIITITKHHSTLYSELVDIYTLYKI